MFGLSDFLQLLMSVLIILPLATIIRESGYYLVAILLGATKKKLVIGNGPKLFPCLRLKSAAIFSCTVGWSTTN